MRPAGAATIVSDAESAVPTLLVAAALAAGCAARRRRRRSQGAPRWTPDGLFYQARSLELRGVDRDTALDRAFQGQLGAELRAPRPARARATRTGSRYNAQFYERRVSVPLAADALEPIAGDRAILDISLAGYVAAVLAIFGLLLMRFRLPIAARGHARHGLPAGADVPLELSAHRQLGARARDRGARVAASSCCERGPRWLVAWAVAILLLSFTRDSTLDPGARGGWLALTLRSRVTWCAARHRRSRQRVPVLLIFAVPMRELLAMMLNEVPAGAGRRPGASSPSATRARSWTCVQADGGFVRDGAWYSAAYLARWPCRCCSCSARGDRREPAITLFCKAGAVAALAYVLGRAGLQRLPARARVRADGGLRPRPCGGAAWRERAPEPRLARMSEFV